MTLLAPIIVWGIVVNNRRTAWVQIPLVFVTLFFTMPNNATTPLTLEATAKTFRYLDQEEIDAQRKAAGPKKP